MNLDKLAEAKGFKVGDLVQFGIRNGQGGVVVPYRDLGGNEYIRSRVLRDPAPANKDGRFWSKGEAPIIPYGIERPVACKRGAMWIVEGESDCWTLWLHGIPAIGIPGTQQFSKLTLDMLEGIKEIAIVEEPDPAGQRFPHQLANHLHDAGFGGKIYAVPLSAKDPRALWLERPSDFVTALREDYRNKRKAIERPQPAAKASPALKLLSYDDLCKMESATADWLVDGLLRRSGLLLLAGRPKCGKSTISRNLARSVGSGTPFLGRACKAGPVIWVGLEESSGDLREALEAMGATALPIHSRIEGFHGDQEEWLRAAVEQIRPALVVIDTIGSFTNLVNINDYSEVVKATRIFLELRNRYGTSFCLNHHTNKNGGVLGATYWEGVVDMTVVMTRNEDGTRFVKSIGFRGSSTVGLDSTTVTLDPDTSLIHAAEPKAITDRRVAEQRILDTLGDGLSRTKEELTRSAGRRAGVARSAIDSLVSQGLALATGTGAKGDPRLYRAAQIPNTSSHTSALYRDEESYESGHSGQPGTATDIESGESSESDESYESLLDHARELGL